MAIIQPQFPPTSNSNSQVYTMSRVQELTDEQLLKRSTHAGRNLSALAILATIIAVPLLIGLVFDLKSSGPHWLIYTTVPFGLLTAGYWMLAVAAKRGNPRPVTIVMVVLSGLLLVSLIGFCMGVARIPQRPESFVSIWGVLIALLIIIVLARSRNVLPELKRRGLWERAFHSAKPSQNLCLVGGILLVVGYVGFYVSLLIPAALAANAAKEMSHAQAFVDMLRGEEASFMAAMREIKSEHDLEALRTATERVGTLDKKIRLLQSAATPDEPISPILKTYAQAVQNWQAALSELKSALPDGNKAMALLKSGDQRRTEALQAFDRKYAPARK